MADRNRTDPVIVTLPSDRMKERRRTVSPDAVPGATSDETLLEEARKRFKMAAEAESRLRQEMLEDLRFRAGEQWPDPILSDRILDKRPSITVNRLPQFIKQITNPQRQARPALQINPVGDGADQETAEVLQGIVRHIEHSSHAEVAFDCAYEDAVTMGRGWFRVLTDYVDEGTTFDQEIVVRRVPNQFTIYVDPAAQEFDYSDARFMFVIDDVPKDEYRAKWGDESYQSLELFGSIGDKAPDWFPEGKVRIAEYWYIEEVEHEIALLPSPVPGHPDLIVPTDRVPKADRKKVKNRRKVKTRKVWCVKMNAARVLSKQLWPGRWIPIVPVLGDEINIDGRKDLVGVVRYARDPQRMYNYWISAQTETIALSPRAPFIGASGQFKGHETQWKQANIRNFAFLEYEPVSSAGQPVGPPQRQTFEPPIGAIVQATRQADNDLKAVIGFYDASLGQPGPDQSGKAILARQKQGEIGNVNWIDNLGRALWHYGRICLDLIPHIYDTPRVLNILGLDDQRRDVTINQQYEDAQGVQRLYDVRKGRYNVTLTIGPNYESRRQEAVASMLQLVSAAPQMLPIIGDLLVGEMDWPMARQIAARLKKTLPPPLQEPEQGGPPPVPPQIQQQMAMMAEQNQQLTAALNEATETIRTKKLELASREFIAAMQTRASLAIGLEKVNAQLAQARLEQEIASTTELMNANHDRLMEEMADVRQAMLQMQSATHAASLQPQQPGAPGGGGNGEPANPAPQQPPGATQ